MNREPSLRPYYQGILMGIDTFAWYQRQSYTVEQSHCYETVLQHFELFKLETAHAIEIAGQPLPQNLPFYQAAILQLAAWRIKRLTDAASLWQHSANDYQKGLKMMEKFMQKHQQYLSSQWLEMLIGQIRQTYALGNNLKLLTLQEGLSPQETVVEP